MKFNHIAGNTVVNLDKTHCVAFFRLGKTSYNKDQNFKNLLNIYHFTGGY